MPAEDWKVIANSSEELVQKLANVPQDLATKIQTTDLWQYKFKRTPPISTYIYHLSAGQYSVIHNTAPSSVPMRIFCREGKVANVPSEEVFRVITEGIKYYEEFTSFKFPWEKYD